MESHSPKEYRQGETVAEKVKEANKLQVSLIRYHWRVKL